MGLGKELGRLAHDRLDRRPGLPRTLNDLAAHVIGELLDQPVPGPRRTPRGDGWHHERARLGVEGDGTPPSVFVKLAPQPPAVRLFVGLARLGPTEISFYERLAPALPIAVPRAHAARYDGRTGRFALVLEDLSPGLRFADVRGARLPPEAEAVVQALAILHAHLRRRRVGALSWVVTNAEDPAAALTARLLRLVTCRGCVAPTPLSSTAIQAMPSRKSQRLFEARLPRDGFTLFARGSPQLATSTSTATCRASWTGRCCDSGLGLRDLAYFLTLSLPTERRRAEERHLLDLYLDVLPRHGGPLLDRSESWNRYRLLVAYPFVAAAFAQGGGGTAGGRSLARGYDRAGAAMDDLDTMDEVRQLLR